MECWSGEDVTNNGVGGGPAFDPAAGAEQGDAGVGGATGGGVSGGAVSMADGSTCCGFLKEPLVSILAAALAAWLFDTQHTCPRLST